MAIDSHLVSSNLSFKLPAAAANSTILAWETRSEYLSVFDVLRHLTAVELRS